MRITCFILILSGSVSFNQLFANYKVCNLIFADTVEGVWKGTSLCQAINSPCHDENVVYYISCENQHNYRVVMNKIVGSKEEDMADLIFIYDAQKKMLTCNLMKDAVWTFTVNKRTISGTLYYKKVLYRLIELQKG